MQKKLLLFLMLLCVSSFILGGCSDKADMEQTKKGQYAVTDSRGRAIDFVKPPTRVVSMHPGTDEFLVNLISTDRILAFSHWMEDAELANAVEYADKVKLRSGYSVEDILKLQPDVVFMTEMGPADFVDALESVGVKVFVYEKPHSIQESMEMQELLAKALKAEERSRQVNAKVQKALDKLQAVGQENQGIRAVVFDYTGRARSTEGTLFGEMLALANVRDVANTMNLPKRAYLTKEQVVQANPDLLIIISWRGDGRFYSGEKVLESIYLDPAYHNMRAVKEKNVVILPIRYTTCNSAYLIPCCEELVQLIKIQETVHQKAIADELAKGRAMLDNIRRGVQPGTAGSSLKLLQTAVKTYQWATTTYLTVAEVKQMVTGYKTKLPAADAQLFSNQLRDIAYEYGNFLDPAQSKNNGERLYDINLTEQDISFPVAKDPIMDALVENIDE